MEKFDYVDSLRGWAVLGVILTHCGYIIPNLSQLMQNVAIEGARGVQLFFIASALTLFYSYNNRKQREDNYIINFFIRRFFRIAPLFYLAGILYTVKNHANPSLGNVIAVLTFTNGWFPLWINSIVPGGWSIAVEMTFYLLMPLLAWKIKDIKTSLLLVFLSLVFQHVCYTGLSIYDYDNKKLFDEFLFYFLPNQLPIFALGIFLYHYKKTNIKLDQWWYFLLISTSLLTMKSLVIGQQILFLQHHISWGMSFVMFAIAISSTKCSVNKLFVNPIISYIGKISFSVYLVHFALLNISKNISLQVSDTFGVTSPTFILLVTFAIATALSVIASTITYHIFEKRFILLGNKIIDILLEYDQKCVNKIITSLIK